MKIYFYLNNEEHTPITSFVELKTNPFKIGDSIHLKVDEMSPDEYNKYEGKFKLNMIKNQHEIVETFNYKTIQIISESKFVRVMSNKEPLLTIEYFCDIINQ
jgi:hypothetical protein